MAKSNENVVSVSARHADDWKAVKTQEVQTETVKVRRTWLWHYNDRKDKEGFNANEFAGRLAAERLETAKNAISAIASPFLSSEVKLPCSEKGIAAVVAQLKESVEKLESDLKARKRKTKVTNIIDM